MNSRSATGTGVEAIEVSSAKQLNDEFDSLSPNLRGTDIDWSKRMKAMKKLQGLILGGATELENFHSLFKPVAFDLSGQLIDLRSQIVREACNTISLLAEMDPHTFEQFATTFVSQTGLLKLISSATKVMAACGHKCLLSILTHVHTLKVIPKIVEEIKNRNTQVRLYISECILTILKSYPDHLIGRAESYIENALEHLITDANSQTRTFSKEGFAQYIEICPSQATTLIERLDSQSQKYVWEHIRKKGGSEASSSRGSVRSSVRTTPKSSGSRKAAAALGGAVSLIENKGRSTMDRWSRDEEAEETTAVPSDLSSRSSQRTPKKVRKVNNYVTDVGSSGKKERAGPSTTFSEGMTASMNKNGRGSTSNLRKSEVRNDKSSGSLNTTATTSGTASVVSNGSAGGYLNGSRTGSHVSNPSQNSTPGKRTRTSLPPKTKKQTAVTLDDMGTMNPRKGLKENLRSVSSHGDLKSRASMAANRSRREMEHDDSISEEDVDEMKTVSNVKVHDISTTKRNNINMRHYGTQQQSANISPGKSQMVEQERENVELIFDKVDHQNWSQRLATFDNFQKYCQKMAELMSSILTHSMWEKIIQDHINHLSDSHFKVSMAAQGSLSSLLPYYPEKFYPHLSFIIPKLLPGLNETKPVLYECSKHTIEMIRRSFSPDDILPLFFKSLEQIKMPKIISITLDTIIAISRQCDSVVNSTSQLKSCLSKLLISVKEHSHQRRVSENTVKIILNFRNINFNSTMAALGMLPEMQYRFVKDLAQQYSPELEDNLIESTKRAVRGGNGMRTSNNFEHSPSKKELRPNSRNGYGEAEVIGDIRSSRYASSRNDYTSSSDNFDLENGRVSSRGLSSREVHRGYPSSALREEERNYHREEEEDEDEEEEDYDDDSHQQYVGYNQEREQQGRRNYTREPEEEHSGNNTEPVVEDLYGYSNRGQSDGNYHSDRYMADPRKDSPLSREQKDGQQRYTRPEVERNYGVAQKEATADTGTILTTGYSHNSDMDERPSNNTGGAYGSHPNQTINATRVLSDLNGHLKKLGQSEQFARGNLYRASEDVQEEEVEDDQDEQYHHHHQTHQQRHQQSHLSHQYQGSVKQTSNPSITDNMDHVIEQAYMNQGSRIHILNLFLKYNRSHNQVFLDSFDQVMACIFMCLDSEDIRIKESSLQVLKDIILLQAPRCYDYSEAIVEKIFENYVFNGQVATGGEDTLDQLAKTQHPEMILRLLLPKIMTEEVPKVQAVIKLVTGVVRFVAPQSLHPLLPDLANSLFERFNHKHADVRKTVVFCLVEVHVRLGEYFEPYLEKLTPSQQKLVQIYVNKRVEQLNQAYQGPRVVNYS